MLDPALQESRGCCGAILQPPLEAWRTSEAEGLVIVDTCTQSTCTHHVCTLLDI